jgi:hypothetical protein
MARITITNEQAELIRNEIRNTLYELLRCKEQLSDEGMHIYSELNSLHKELTAKLARACRCKVCKRVR